MSVRNFELIQRCLQRLASSGEANGLLIVDLNQQSASGRLMQQVQIEARDRATIFAPAGGLKPTELFGVATGD